MDIKTTYQNICKNDIMPIQQYCDDVYKENKFDQYFCNVTALIGKMEAKLVPISDDDLEWILINLPLKLFDASEALNRLKLSSEVLKLKLKEKRAEDNIESIQEYSILKIIYENLISQVETKISLSKELIMGAKKVWDSRRSAEKSNPVKEIDLPEYKSNNTYIK